LDNLPLPITKLTKLISSNHTNKLRTKHLENSKTVSEPSVEQIVGQTFRMYSRNFVWYLIPFLTAGAIAGLATITVRLAFNIHTNPVVSTAQLLFPLSISTPLMALLISAIAGWIASTFATGIAIKYTSDKLQQGYANLQTSFNFTLTKILYLLAANLITTVLIIIGSLALIVPGIILAIIFLLVSPAIMLEDNGFFGSFSVSSLLVSQRWQKTFGLMLVIGVISLVAAFVVNIIASPFGEVSLLVTRVLMAFVTPISAISTTIYYFAMKTRTLPPPHPPPEQISF
jgi:hypothetical protein